MIRYAIHLLLGAASLAAQGPENVLVIVNAASPRSREIGEYYRKRRAIPKRNICQIQAATTEEIARATYDKEIAAPVGECLKSRGLVESVLFLATTLDVPLKIRPSGFRRKDMASVDSELALLYASLHGRAHDIDGPLQNPFYGQRDAPFRHPRFPMYLVTRLAAYSVEEVKGMIDRSLAAKNSGKVVLDLAGADDRQGNDWLRTAAILLPADRVIVDETGAVLAGQKGVIGYAAWGSNDKARKERFLGFEWLPGAIATEYVSTNGRTFQRPPDTWAFSTWKNEDRPKWFAGSPQGLTADCIHEGATGASGHVYEPYLGFTPRPEHLFPAYLAGRTLAESFYLSIPALSWQNIVVGDPLCRLAR